MRSLKIGYVTTGSSSDISNWSGLVKNIRDALESCGHTIFDIDDIVASIPSFTRIQGWWTRFVLRQPYGYDRDLRLAQSFARQAERKLRDLDLDCIVSPRTYPTAMLNTSLPIVSWGDATFHALMELYPGYATLSAGSIRQGHELERRAMRQSTLLVFSSQWAADDAIRFYGADPSKAVIIPFGPNCTSPFDSMSVAKAAVTAKPATPFRMLFVGVDWERKGGPLALATLAELRQRGVNAELWIVGCRPFKDEPPPGVRCFGPLTKSKPEDMIQWNDCFRQCHVYFMPTRAECFGVVFAEAAAYALPSIATRVGGVPNAVADGVSGFLLEPDADAADYANQLEHLARNPIDLHQLSLNAWQHHSTKLNWAESVTTLTAHLQKRLKGLKIKL